MKINLEKILDDFTLFTGVLGNVDKPKLISFAFDFQYFNPLIFIDRLYELSNDIFLFQTPNNKITVCGFNSALEVTSEKNKNFASAADTYSHWKKNFKNNWNEKNILSEFILCCSAKFDAESSSDEWGDFRTLRIYVPEFIFAFQNNEVSVRYNFVVDIKSNINIVSDILLSLLKKLSAISETVDQTTNQRVSIQSLTESIELEKWIDISTKALKELNIGIVEKLVLSRALSFRLKTTITWNLLLTELFKKYPDCYLFFIKKNDSVFFGSSPEMFLKISENTAEVESVAGSAARGEKSDSDFELEKSLKTSDKNHLEHLFVSEFISEILFRYSDNVRIIEEKQIRKLDTIQHLITRISAELISNDKLFELIDALFPTPAVCGVPKELAKSLIRKFETHNRGLYSGLVGLIDFNGNCELAVSIRSALVKENIVTAFAGAGLIKSSNPEEEFFETNLKLKTILSLFTDENKSK